MQSIKKLISFKKCAKLVNINTRYLQTMSAWQLSEYKGINSLTLNEEKQMPTIKDPNELIIKVNACSVNPLDVQMCSGYGNNLFDWLNLFTQFKYEKITYDRFPITLGRDFSGTIIDKGESVRKYNIGDKVWGVTNPYDNGSHSQYVNVHQCNISHKPENVSHEEASSLPYASLTAWSALSTFGELGPRNAWGKQILVLGGSGGVGTIAIQLAKIWGANVTTTCSNENIDWLKEVTNVDECIDYKDQTVFNAYENYFDLIIDASVNEQKRTVHQDAFKTLKKWSNSKYITLTSPLLNELDKNGLLNGSLRSIFKATYDTINGISEGKHIRWAYFHPNPTALATLKVYVENGLLKPIVEKVFSFNELPMAFEKVFTGHAKGKTVIKIQD